MYAWIADQTKEEAIFSDGEDEADDCGAGEGDVYNDIDGKARHTLISRELIVAPPPPAREPALLVTLLPELPVQRARMAMDEEDARGNRKRLPNFLYQGKFVSASRTLHRRVLPLRREPLGGV